tara:strand:+ start:1291 stop:1533 length:243 start_codon:yes stop_codon:yes gene_type:complete
MKKEGQIFTAWISGTAVIARRTTLRCTPCEIRVQGEPVSWAYNMASEAETTHYGFLCKGCGRDSTLSTDEIRRIKKGVGE